VGSPAGPSVPYYGALVHAIGLKLVVPLVLSLGNQLVQAVLALVCCLVASVSA